MNYKKTTENLTEFYHQDVDPSNDPIQKYLKIIDWTEKRYLSGHNVEISKQLKSNRIRDAAFNRCIRAV